MRAKHAQTWQSLPRLRRERVALAIDQLINLLEIDQKIKSGPLSVGVLALDDLASYRFERLKRDYLKKYPGFTWGNPREAAIKEFWRCEDQNRETNARLRAFSEKGYDPLGLRRYMDIAASLISGWLGPFNWSDLLPHGRWGPGVTSSTKGGRLHASNKFQAKPEVTPAFMRTGRWLIGHLPSWACLLADIDYPAWVTPLLDSVQGNRITFVPKDASTDRTIAVEPHVNIFFQLAAGSLIRSKLKARGLDLDDQTPNQEMARLGSIDDSLSTIDLKSASNTLSYRLVMDLLPIDWFCALDRLRSHFGTLDGKRFPYQMFSSMGNGFTFELESMIFYALTLAVAQVHGYNPFWVRAYGDDIICPSGINDEVVRLLSFCGFTVNREKSYSSGPFRESCGKDYLRGRLVRPVFLKEIPDNPLAWIKIANNLKRLASVWGEGVTLDSRLKPAYDFAVSMIPRKFRRLSVSDGFGDIALIRDFDEACPRKHPDGWDGWLTNVILTRPIRYESTDRGLVTAGVHRPAGQDGNRLPIRDQVEHTIGSLYCPFWRNLGPWS